MNVLVDVDNVLAGLAEALSAQVERETVRRLALSDWTEYYCWDNYPYSDGIDGVRERERVVKAVSEALASPDFIMGIPLIAGSHELIHAARELGEVHIVTARQGLLWDYLTDWLRQEELFRLVSGVHFRPASAKANYARDKPCGLAIDDRLDTCYAMTKHCRVYMPAHAWNCFTSSGHARETVLTDTERLRVSKHLVRVPNNAEIASLLRQEGRVFANGY